MVWTSLIHGHRIGSGLFKPYHVEAMLTPFDATDPKGSRRPLERLSLLWHLWWGVRTSIVIDGTEEGFWSKVNASTLTMTPRNLAGVLKFMAAGGGPPRLEQLYAFRFGKNGNHVALRLANDVSRQFGVTGSGSVHSDGDRHVFTVRIVLKNVHRVLVVLFFLIALILLVVAGTQAVHVNSFAGAIPLVVALILAVLAIAGPLMGMDGASRRARVIYRWAVEVSGGPNNHTDIVDGGLPSTS